MGAKTGIVRGLEDLFIPILRKCRSTTELKRIHCQMEKFSLLQSNFLVTRMLDICDENGETEYSSLLFRNVNDPNIYLYNAIIRVYTHNQNYVLTINTYKQMLKNPGRGEEHIFPDRFTYPFVIRACGGLADARLGKQVHGHVCRYGLVHYNIMESSLLDMYVKCDAISEAHSLFDQMSERDTISWNSLISGHMKCGRVRTARALFEQMPNKNIVSWTTMISGYTKTGSFGDALDVFRRMQILGIPPDWISLVTVLPACAQLGALELGKWIHIYADQKGFLRKTAVCNALMEMYTKCGSVDQAMQLFRNMQGKDVISWSTVIVGLANHGRAAEALEYFDRMRESKVDPNEITFIGLLSACAHAGLSDEAHRYFDSMQNDYHIEPGIEHYGCLIDLLGRTGKIEQALNLISSMKIKPDSAIWVSLLSSCRTYRNLETAVIAMEHVLELEPEDTGNLVLLANIYADLGMWDEVSRMRKFMRSRSMKKAPGCSMIEVNRVVEEFTSGDTSKPFSKEIFQMLELFALHQSKATDPVGIVPGDLKNK